MSIDCLDQRVISQSFYLENVLPESFGITSRREAHHEQVIAGDLLDIGQLAEVCQPPAESRVGLHRLLLFLYELYPSNDNVAEAVKNSLHLVCTGREAVSLSQLQTEIEISLQDVV